MSRGHAITAWSFADALATAGIVSNVDRISEIRIVCKPSEAVTIEVTYFADERIYGLARPEYANPVIPHEYEEGKD